ncbi:regulatory protein GntR HTH [Clostridium sp. CAG:411]|jgi:GntR family transcriptional regulator|nr:GntR family transcriptional regulator [Lachnospiraceae bacterium]CDE47153.1 regulatory protein GntR HTH [Clostridium sp. CAG:411]
MAWSFKEDRPIYTQLLEQIQARIVTGQYKIGERLPSVRELAAEAGVNPNTMQRALAELERIGLVYSQRTSGRMITDDAQKIGEMKMQLAQDVIEEFLQNMKKLGYEQKEIAQLIEQYPTGKRKETEKA